MFYQNFLLRFQGFYTSVNFIYETWNLGKYPFPKYIQKENSQVDFAALYIFWVQFASNCLN